MRYARKIDGGHVDYIDIPQPWPEGYWTNDPVTFCEKMFPDTTGWEQVADDAGDVPVPTPAPQPKLLTKTAFQDYAISQLGGGVTGMGRFTDIMDATAASASSAVRFAFARYTAADTFEKTQTGVLTGIMAADTQAGHITADERAAILNNWPTA